MKEKIILIVIIAALLGGAFYWFQWRPAQIRKNCYLDAKYSGGFVNIKTAEGLPSLKMIEISGEQLDKLYRNCLRENGLEK